MAMENLAITKQSLISLVRDLNGIINDTRYENCYTRVVQFFNLTSKLDDRWIEISELPLKGWKFWGFKSKDRKQAEADRAFFFKEVKKAGRCPCGINRTKRGEEVTKDNVYFGDIHGIWTDTVAKFEALENPSIQEVIRWQIVEFVQSYMNSFNNLDWLK